MATTPMFTAARRGKPSKNRLGWVAVLGAVLLMMALRASVLGAVRRSIARSSTSDGRATSTGHTKEAALRDRDEGALDEDDADAEEDKLADEEEEEGLAAEDAQALYASNEKLDTEASLAELPHVVDDEALPRKHRRRRAPRLGNSEDVHSVVVGRQGATVIKERPLVPGAVRIAHKQSSAEQRQGDEVLSENFMRLSRGDQDGNDQDDQVANSLGGDGSTARMRQRRNSREDAERRRTRLCSSVIAVVLPPLPPHVAFSVPSLVARAVLRQNQPLSLRYLRAPRPPFRTRQSFRTSTRRTP